MSSTVLTLILAGLAMVGPFAIDTYLPSLPEIGRHFAIMPLLAQQTLSVYLFALAVMTLVYGTLSDSFGRRPVVLGSLVIFTVASLGAALATSYTWLLIFRGLQGASAGAGRIIGQAIVRDRFHGATAQRMMANITMVFGIAPAIAPIIGGFLQVAFGWRSTFGFMALITLVLLAACLRALPETLPVTSRQPFNLGSIARNSRAALRHPQFLLLSLALGFAFGGFALYISSAANFVMTILQLPETAFAWLFGPMIGGMIIGSAFGSKLSHTVAASTLIRYGFTIMGTAALLNVSYNATFAATVPWAVLPLGLYTFGLALVMPGLTLMNLDMFPTMRGLASSLQSFVQMLIFALVSGFVAPLLFGSALKLAAGAAAAVVFSLLCWQLGVRRKGAG